VTLGLVLHPRDYVERPWMKTFSDPCELFVVAA
jgi:hypothetical protein